MIKYTLQCANEHRFESWFQSADAFEKLNDRNLVVCEHCGDTDISKTLMAPGIPTRENSLSTKEKTKIEELRDHVEKTADYVGNTFYTEARAMHEGEKPERAIYGQANAKEAKSLIEDGIPVVPLPFTPKKQTN